jgi:hypothetical protein
MGDREDHCEDQCRSAQADKHRTHSGFMRRQQIGTAGGSPLRSLCSNLTEAIESRLPHRENYQAAHILRIKKDVRSVRELQYCFCVRFNGLNLARGTRISASAQLI